EKCDFHEDMCGLINLAAWSSYKWQRRQAESFSLEQGTSVPDTDSQKNKQGYFAVLTGKSYMYVSQIGVGTKIRRFSQTANTGKEWQFASITIGNYPAGKVFEFHGNADYQKVGSEVQDIAIDNINYINCDPNLIYSESLNCTFDYDDCGWHPDNNFTVATWSRAKSSPQNYGPKSDHTGRKGYFMYVSGNYMRKGNKAHLVSLKQKRHR
ncbi:MAM and LDL-receptor class A domain-containing protein, partial [Caerostris extrusa]